MGNSPIPFLDLVTPHRELKEELTDVFRRALDTAGFIGGAMVEAFEREFAQFCGTQFSVAVSSGTDALLFALIAAGVKAGDVVVTVPNTFIATTEAISQAGATPEFVDVDEQTYNLDPEKLREYLEARCTRDSGGRLVSRRSGQPVTAVIPVHLYGQPADMDPILELAEKFELSVIEDACQAHGAEYFSKRENRWRKCGSMGRASAFSFYPGKNLGACGEGGAVTTNDPEVSRMCKMLRDHGQARKYYHDIEGFNGRLDSIQCGILSVKLRHLPEWNRLRREHAAEYNRLLERQAEHIVTPKEPSWSKGVFHLYVVRTDDREGLQAHLAAANIGTAIHYPVPIHLQKAYAHLGYRSGEFPVTDKITAQIASLPMFPQLTREQQKRVVEQVASFETAEVAVPH